MLTNSQRRGEFTGGFLRSMGNHVAEVRESARTRSTEEVDAGDMTWPGACAFVLLLALVLWVVPVVLR